MSWDYAEMSKEAKACGGPEKWVDTIKNSGRKDMIPFLFLAFGAGIVATRFSQKIAVSKQDIKRAKENLIKGIKEYDKAQQNIDLNKTKTDIHPK